MAIEPELEELYSSIITLEPATTRDAFGKRAYGTPQEWKAHIQYKFETAVDPAGNQVPSAGRIYLYGVAEVSIDDRITLPDGAHPTLVGIEQEYDENGPHHTVLIMGGAGGRRAG